MDRFARIPDFDEDELRDAWIWLGEERSVGEQSLAAFEAWLRRVPRELVDVETAASGLGLFLRGLAKDHEAEILFRRALAAAEAQGTTGPSARRAGHLGNLAQVLKATGRLAEAEPLMRRALELVEGSDDHDPVLLVAAAHNLASLLEEADRRVDADPLFRSALRVCEEKIGADHPRTATCLSAFGLHLLAMGNLDDAGRTFERALAIDESNFGRDHPRIATRLNNLACWMQACDRTAQAEPLLLRALTIEQKSYGPDHPYLGVRNYNLARLLLEIGRADEALPFARRSVEIFLACSRAAGHRHPGFVRALKSYVELLRELGQGPAGFRRALQGLGPEAIAALHEGAF
jgi:tetratricopeptide (TPR) repeat protein